MIMCLLMISGLSIITQSRSPDYDKIVIQSDYNKTDNKMYVLVNSSVYSSLKDELSVYKDDVENLKGIEVEIYENTYSDPQQIRSFLRDGYRNDGLVGTFFVGNLPYAQYEMDYSPEYYYRFPIDFYYMDVDGSWIDSDDDGYFDDHTHGSSNLWPDIWFGRICMKTGWKEEISLYENYFEKVHKYRMGELTLPHKALHYVDDDWVNWTDEYSKGLKDLYPDTTLVNDKEITNATDYGKRLHEGYEWIQIHCHANHSAKRHAFKLDDGPKGSGGNFTSRDLCEEGQRSLFANIFTCGSANYTVSNYLCGWYALTEEYGLANVGTTKSGSMLNFEDYYEPILEGKNLGEYLQEGMRENVEDNRWWF